MAQTHAGRKDSFSSAKSFWDKPPPLRESKPNTNTNNNDPSADDGKKFVRRRSLQDGLVRQWEDITKVKPVPGLIPPSKETKSKNDNDNNDNDNNNNSSSNQTSEVKPEEGQGLRRRGSLYEMGSNFWKERENESKLHRRLSLTLSPELNVTNDNTEKDNNKDINITNTKEDPSKEENGDNKKRSLIRHHRKTDSDTTTEITNTLHESTKQQTTEDKTANETKPTPVEPDTTKSQQPSKKEENNDQGTNVKKDKVPSETSSITEKHRTGIKKSHSKKMPQYVDEIPMIIKNTSVSSDAVNTEDKTDKGKKEPPKLSLSEKIKRAKKHREESEKSNSSKSHRGDKPADKSADKSADKPVEKTHKHKSDSDNDNEKDKLKKPEKESRSKDRIGKRPHNTETVVKSEEMKKIEERKKRILEFKKKKAEEEARKQQSKQELDAQQKREERKRDAAAAAALWKKKKEESERKKKEEEQKKKDQDKDQDKKTDQDKKIDKKIEEKKQKEDEERRKREGEEKKLKEDEEKKKKEDQKKQEELNKETEKQKEAAKKQEMELQQKEEQKRKEKEQQEAKAKKSQEPNFSDEEGSDDDIPSLEKALTGIAKNSIDLVDLKMEGLDDETISQLLKSLINNVSVHELLLDGNEMEVKSFMLINELLMKNNSIHSMSLNFVMLGELGARTIAKGLATNSTLINLSVSGNDLFENGMDALGIGLKENVAMKVLNLSENSISDAGCKSLLDIMSYNNTIEQLDLSNNYINEEGAEYLATMMEKNTSLLKLNLERNSLEDGGCDAFAQSLYKNNTLQELYLGNNIIETEGMLALADALKANNSLRYVELKQNIFDIESEIALQDVVIQKEGKLTISWKKPPSKDDPSISRNDIQAILDHFGAKKILELYGAGRTTEPLIDIEILLNNIEYTVEDARFMWNIVFPLKGTGFHNRLNVLVNILNSHLNEKQRTIEFGKLFAEHVVEMQALLAPRDVKMIQWSRVQTLQLFRTVCKMEDLDIASRLVKSDIVSTIVDLFFMAAQSIYLTEFVELITQLLTDSASNYLILSQLLIQVKFLHRMMELTTTESAKPVPKRTGNFGHMTKISNKLQEISQTNLKLQKMLQGTSGWSSFVQGTLEQINAVNRVPEKFKPSLNPANAKKVKIEDFDDTVEV